MPRDRSVESPTVLFERPETGGWNAYGRPVEVLSADRLDQVLSVVERAEEAAERGLVACGYLSYEAGPAFDDTLRAQPAGDLPLAWFGLFDPEGEPLEDLEGVGGGADFAHGDWSPSVDRDSYRRAIARIHAWIAEGETYQVNYTLRLASRFEGSALAYFEHLARHHSASRAAWLDTGRHALLSLSPELFFDYADGRLTARPMKGTAPRGRTPEEDREAAEDLHASPKNRAENVMIVDMVRNDLGRVARPGTVEVPSLWDVERYPTLFQMTSTVTAESDAPVSEVLAALFPSASITGAPKARTTELIAAIEDSPRGIYTGAIGSIGPGRRASFNVAIRTLHIDRETGRAEYGTGGGIVWDSAAEAEYAECLTKALVVTEAEPEFDLLETLRWTPEGGFFLLERHLERLAGSAAYFDRPCDLEDVRRNLKESVEEAEQPQRVRLTLASDGSVAVDCRDLEPIAPTLTVTFARRPIASGDRFLFHKTTHRRAYERALEGVGEVDDALLWNERGEVTESTIANLVVERHGERLTPALDAGLLAGTMRAELLARGGLREAVLTRQEVVAADALYLINSVRGEIPARLVEPQLKPSATASRSGSEEVPR